jgi:hypothetical protein
MKDGTQVPGASTICKVGDDQSNLITWAWNLGNKGQDFRKVSDKAADIGTVCHFLIECHFHNWQPDLSEYSPATLSARTLPSATSSVVGRGGLHRLEPEVQLVSEQYLFGGTIDAPSVDKHGKIVLLDWKTSNGIYLRKNCNSPRYEQLWNENDRT